MKLSMYLFFRRVAICNPDSVSMLLQLGGRLSGKIISEAAKYQLKKGVIRKVLDEIFCI